MHGLSDWVLDRLAQEDNAEVDASTLKALSMVAQNQADTKAYESCQEKWELLAQEFLQSNQDGEPSLYQSKGAELTEIQHKADTSEFANTCAGTMCLFQFP